MCKFILTTMVGYLNESYLKKEFSDIMFGDYYPIFSREITSNNARIEDRLIVSFYINEYLKYYKITDLKKVKDWNEFIEKVHHMWISKNPTQKQEIVFRRGDSEGEMFFSNNIKVAAVYGGILNAYILDFKKPYILDCNDSNWMDITEPKIMRGYSVDGKVSTDNIVEFIRKTKKYDGIILKNLYEGSGASVYGASTIYISLDKKNIINLTNN